MKKLIFTHLLIFIITLLSVSCGNNVAGDSDETHTGVAVFSGHILAENGIPFSGAEVEIFLQQDDTLADILLPDGKTGYKIGKLLKDTITDNDGRFKLTLPDLEEYRINVTTLNSYGLNSSFYMDSVESYKDTLQKMATITCNLKDKYADSTFPLNVNVYIPEIDQELYIDDFGNMNDFLIPPGSYHIWFLLRDTIVPFILPDNFDNKITVEAGEFIHIDSLYENGGYKHLSAQDFITIYSADTISYNLDTAGGVVLEYTVSVFDTMHNIQFYPLDKYGVQKPDTGVGLYFMPKLTPISILPSDLTKPDSLNSWSPYNLGNSASPSDTTAKTIPKKSYSIHVAWNGRYWNGPGESGSDPYGDLVDKGLYSMTIRADGRWLDAPLPANQVFILEKSIVLKLK